MIPIKDYIYGVLILILLMGFGWYTVHERNIGKEEIRAADQRVVAAQTIHDAEVIKRASIIAKAGVSKYKAKLAATPSTNIPSSWVCNNPSSTGVPTIRPPGPSHNVPPEESAVVRGPIPPEIDKRFGDDDGKVLALQAYITACQEAGRCARGQDDY